MKFLSLLLLTGALPLALFAQSQRETALQQINTLKNGYLVVRLKTGDLQIKALEKAGDAKAAQAYKLKVEAENKQIRNAFINNFRFCPVYFCYTSCSVQITGKKPTGCLLNEQLQPDSSIVVPDKPFLTAEFGFSGQQQFEGLITMDEQFIQLKPPFPFLMKKYDGVAHKRTMEEMVIKLDKELNSFYNSK
jgi:hypothetical protein